LQTRDDAPTALKFCTTEHIRHLPVLFHDKSDL